MKIDLENKIALITGSGGAIGRAIALSLAENGANIIINDLNEENGNKVIREIEEIGTKAIYIKADVSNPEQMRDMAEQAINTFGRIDILVNNAGVNVGPDGRAPIHEYAEENWSRIIKVDLDGIYFCSKPIVKQMVNQKYGKIINISSITGLVPLRLQCAYTAAKAGVISLTKAMALELAEYGINVNTIAPGSILTEGTKELFYADAAKAESIISHIPLNRPGTPEDIANAALFLAADESNYMTGSVVIVDGGWTCGYIRDW